MTPGGGTWRRSFDGLEAGLPLRPFMVATALLILLFTKTGCGGSEVTGGFRHDASEGLRRLKKFTGLYTGPYFDQIGNPANVTAQLGETAILPCRVKQIGQRTVSWIRRRDSHILTVDDVTFISNDRFFILRDGSDQDKWTLHIRYAMPSDAGIYECQISTEPKMSRCVHLDVKETRVWMEGNSDVHANAGSTVVLKCHIAGTLQKPDFVFWYHGSRRLMPERESNMNTTIRTVVVSNNHSYSGSSKQQHYEAELTLSNVQQSQSGNYSCSPSNTGSVSVRLHLIDGEIRAAMSDGTSCCDYNLAARKLPILLFLLITTLYRAMG